MQCTTSSVPTNSRSTGHAELVADILLTCAGGTPTAVGQPIPQGTISVILDTPVTSRILASGWSEALLLVDEPGPGTQNVCASAGGICNLQGTGNGVGSYDGTLGRANVYQGQPAFTNEVDFASIPLDPPGTSGKRVFRITNIRGDATSAPASGRINMQVSAIGSTIGVNGGQLVSNAQAAVSFTAKSIQTGAPGITQFAVSVAEKFANVFRTRTIAVSNGNNFSPTPAAQAIPGGSYAGSETGFYNPSFPLLSGRGNLGLAGLADSGTRIYVQIANPGAGITIATNAASTTTSGGVLRLINTDATGAGNFAPLGVCCGAVTLSPDTTGTIRAVFEVLSANPTSIESVDLPFFVTSSAGNPVLTSLSLVAGLAPMNGAGADLTSPLPRFTGTTGLTIAASAASAPVQVSTQSLQFNAFLGGDSPGPQMVAVTTSASIPAGYSVIVDSGTQGSAAPSWLTIQPTSGVTPGTLVVFATLGNLPAGTQAARIRVVPKDATQPMSDIAVTFTIASAPPQMDVSPRSLSFVSRAGAAGILEQQLLVRNRGGGSVKVTATIVGGQTPAGISWLTDVTPASGQTTQDNPVLIRVHVNPQGLGAGVYSATIHVVSDTSVTCNGSASAFCDIGVTLQVTTAGPILRLSTVGLRFLAIAGNPATRSQNVEVIDDGDPNSSVNFTADLLQGSDWLSIVNGHGMASPGKPGSITLAPTAAVSGFGAGPHYAVLRVTDANSQNSPQFLTAVLDVAVATTPPFPDPFPSGLFFTAAQGSAQLAPGIASITVSSNTAVTYQASAVTRDGAAWLSITPASGVTSSATPGQLQIVVTPTGLQTGSYSGDVTVAIGASVRVVRVSLVVQPAQPKSVSRAAAGCTPSQMVLTDNAFADGSIVPAGYPALLTMLVNDDCGTPVTDASVVTSFDNGDAPLTLFGDGTGSYANSWVPGRVASSITIKFSATDANLPPPPATATAPATSFLRIGTVSANSIAPPVQSRGGTVNNVNPVLGAPLAPGMVASVYGSGLATVTTPENNPPPLPKSFSNTQILVAGIQAPIYSVSPGQVNIQIPLELAPNQKYPVLALLNGVPAIPDSIIVAVAAPGMYSLPDGTTVAQHLDASLVDATHPAKPGEALMLYLIGMGLTNQPLVSGQGSPSNPLATVSLPPTVTLDGETVVPFFTGLTPGFVGLFQMNIIVPTDARSGALTLTVTQGNLAANVTKLIVAR